VKFPQRALHQLQHFLQPDVQRRRKKVKMLVKLKKILVVRPVEVPKRVLELFSLVQVVPGVIILYAPNSPLTPLKN